MKKTANKKTATKTRVKKTSNPKTKQTNKRTKSKSIKNTAFKGRLGAGTLYFVVGLAILGLGAAAMTGNITPLSTKSPETGQPVNVTPPSLERERSNLQLFTFPGATYTPTPAPTLPPQPQQRWEEGDSYEESHGDSWDGGDSYSCFPAGTKILLANGTEKNIEEIKIGEKVLGFDGEKQVSETVMGVEAPIRDHLYRLTFADGTELKLTREHPLYTTNGWKSLSPTSTSKENSSLNVDTLKIGDKVLTSNDDYIALTKIEYLPGEVQTYNLKNVSCSNDFYADGKLAHNKGSCFVAGTQILMADGTNKNIEDVKVGEKVKGYDGEDIINETVLEVEEVTRDHYYDITFDNGVKLGLTDEHPLYTDKGWASISPKETFATNPDLAALNVKELKVGDKVLNNSKKYNRIISIEYHPGDILAYNLHRVTGHFNFFANSFLAHNRGSRGDIGRCGEKTGGGGGGSSGGGGTAR